jgi:type IV pilus assembly protein PilW
MNITRRLQRGRTIIELMIAIAISTMIMLGITTIYSASTNSARSAVQQGAMSEDGALSLHLIGQAIKRANYGEIIGTDFVANNQTLFDFPGIRACKNGRFNNPAAGDFSCNTVAGAPDSLMIQFQGDAVAATTQLPTTNCVGSTGVLTQISAQDHPGFLQEVPLVSNVYEVISGNLSCSGNGSAFQTLAGNIEEFKVYFGYDNDAADQALNGQTTISPSAHQIVDADFVRTKDASFAGRDRTAWDFVVSVHVCVVARTRERGTSVQTTVSYESCPENPSQVVSSGTTKTANDATVRKTYKNVFAVRANATASPAIRLKP